MRMDLFMFVGLTQIILSPFKQNVFVYITLDRCLEIAVRIYMFVQMFIIIM